MKNLILIIIHIIALYVVAGNQITIMALEETIYIKTSIINSYEDGVHKEKRVFLKKGWDKVE